MARRPSLSEQLAEAKKATADATARADAAEAAQNAALRADPADHLVQTGKQAVRELNRLSRETWAVLAGVLLIVLGAGHAVGAHDGSGFAEGKGAHLGHVMAFMFAGAFVAFVIGWIVNKWRPIRERAAPAADDSIKSVEEQCKEGYSETFHPDSDRISKPRRTVPDRSMIAASPNTG